MIIPIIESNPKNSMSICFIESREIFLWISYETYCL